jgi:predicted ATPase
MDAAWYRVESGEVKESSEKVMPVGTADQLYLVRASHVPAFRPVFDSFSRMGFYNLNPDAIRELQAAAPGEVLRRDGSNLASVLAFMEKYGKDARDRVLRFLSSVVPGISDVYVRHLGKKETLEFKQEVIPGEVNWQFMAESMSDGALRALGVLAALFQATMHNGHRVPLVGIEEPETAVHPGAAGVLRDALRVASASTQVVVTSHSPDLLDDKDVSADWILGVVSEKGETKIGPIDEADRNVLRKRLFTAGELLKRGQLGPDPEKLKQVTAAQLELFGRPDA